MGSMKHLIAGALFFAFLQTGCEQKQSNSPSILNFYVKEKVRSMDPILAGDIYSQQVVAQVYEGLLHFHYLKRPLQLEPLLAEALPEISPDGRVYTIKIKKNVLFHRDPLFKNKPRELRAQDFIFSWMRLMDPALKSENIWLFKDRIVGLDEWRAQKSKNLVTYETPVEGLRALDSHTLQIQLKKPDYQFLYLLGHSAASVVAREIVEHYGDKFHEMGVGTGPFVLEKWTRGSQMVFVKNPSYRDEFFPSEGETADVDHLRDAGKRLPLTDRVIVREIPEEQPQWLSFVKGDLDILQVTKDYIPVLMDGSRVKGEFELKGIRAQVVSGLDIVYTCMNTENPFLKNKKIRQAIAHAYNVELSKKKFFADLGVISHGPLPPDIEGYRSTLSPRSFDLERAKKLLIEAGYPQGRGLPTFVFDMGATHATARQLGEFFQQQMKQVGIKVKLRSSSWSEFSQRVSQKKSDLFESSWNGDYPDAENFLQLFSSANVSPGPNAANFKNIQFDQWLAQARSLPPGPERTRLYQNMEDLVVEESPWIYKLHRSRVYAAQRWVYNYKPQSSVMDGLKYIRVDKRTKNH